MKNIFYSYILAIFLLFSPPLAFAEQSVELTIGSWRWDDLAAMQEILAKFTAEYPQIRIIFKPTPPADYDAVLQAQLEGGTGPDIMYLRSFSASRSLYAQGFLTPLDDLPGLQENFDTPALNAWSHQGKVYGLPMVGVAQVIFYNKDIFARLHLAIPTTWEELLQTARMIQLAGVIPFANTSGDPWATNELIFSSIAVNFLGCREGSQKYLTGERCFNDQAMIDTFQAVADLHPFLPPTNYLLRYMDSLQLFAQGQTAMWFGGSWDIPFFEEEITNFHWDVFAPPPPQGSPTCLVYHLDAALGINAKSRHQEAARTFLLWIARPENGQLISNMLPGFFPVHKHPLTIDNPHANAILQLLRQHETDIRFGWDILRDGTPSSYDLIQYASYEVLNGRMAPVQAAQYLHDGLAQWFAPAQNCNQQQ